MFVDIKTDTSVFESIRISKTHFSMGSGWHIGMRLEVCFAAMVPAIIAVENTGPFGLFMSPSD